MTIERGEAADGMMFAARHLTEGDRWDEAERFIREILALERSTHPDGGAETQDRKDAKAREALRLAGQLVRAVAGWAIDHVAGVAANGASGAESILPDDHRHESQGWAIQIDDGNAETVGRAIIAQLIECNPGALPQAVKRAAVASLESLDYGEVLPLVTATKINRHRRLSDLRHQLRALQHVAYRAHLPGTKIGEVRVVVARAYGIDPETLRTAWTYRVRKELSPGEAERALQEARRDAAAKIVPFPASDQEGMGVIMRVYPEGEAVVGPDSYNDAALHADGQAYLRKLGSKKQLVPRPRKVLRRSRDTQHDTR